MMQDLLARTRATVDKMGQFLMDPDEWTDEQLDELIAEIDTVNDLLAKENNR